MPWRPGAENTSLVLNNGMIAPLVPYALRGVIWYQGEANADQPETYREIFGALIAAWREQFQEPDLPFYWVQLANWDPDHAIGTSWAFLREAQTQTLALPHTGQAVTIDIGDTEDIHPTNKQDVGARLARLTLARDFGRDLEDTGPTFVGANLTGGAMAVSFDHAAGLTTTDGAAPLAFELAGPDKVFHPATAVLDGNEVTVSAPDVPQPLYVRYAGTTVPPSTWSTVPASLRSFFSLTAIVAGRGWSVPRPSASPKPRSPMSSPNFASIASAERPLSRLDQLRSREGPS